MTGTITAVSILAVPSQNIPAGNLGVLLLLARRDEAILSGRPAAEVERRGIGRLELREILLEG